MSYSIRRRVHIAPQGYEEERIYKPAIEMEADKVILLTTRDDQSQECRETVEQELDDAGIEHETRECNIFDPDESVQKISQIIKKNPRHDIKVNLATGSKITAISGMLACMLTDADPYYVRAEEYGDPPVSEGVKSIESLPAYPIDPPESHLVEVLDFISRHDDDEPVIFGDISDYVEENEIGPVGDADRDDDTDYYDIVKRDFITPLEEKGLIDTQRRPPSKVVLLTETGERTLEFSRHLLDEHTG